LHEIIVLATVTCGLVFVATYLSPSRGFCSTYIETAHAHTWASEIFFSRGGQ